MILYLKEFEEDGEVEFDAFLSELDFWADCEMCREYVDLYSCAECKHYGKECISVEILFNEHFKICPHWRDREDIA